jgi:hypothetical protein
VHTHRVPETLGLALAPQGLGWQGSIFSVGFLVPESLGEKVKL